MGSPIASAQLAALAGVALAAATVNGALGYGFSSITMPAALLFLTNRRLNPAMVLVELLVNAHALLVNRRGVPRVWRRTLPVLAGLAPGVALGSGALFRVGPEWLKLATYAALLPLILLQAGGVRRPLGSEAAAGLPFGAGLGLLYSTTTISGPPLALFLNNQGYAKDDFRAALALIRTVEAALTAASYLALGLYARESLALAAAMAPSVLVGIPVGAALIRSLDPEAFRRVCMSFDAWIVGYGLSKVSLALGLASGLVGYAPLMAAGAIDAALLGAFVARRRAP